MGGVRSSCLTTGVLIHLEQQKCAMIGLKMLDVGVCYACACVGVSCLCPYYMPYARIPLPCLRPYYLIVMLIVPILSHCYVCACCRFVSFTPMLCV